MIELPQEYIIQKFYELAGSPKHNSITNVYNGGCPICREGKSWGRKKRAFYVPKDNVILCHNCGWYGSPLKWIREVTNFSYEEIQAESADYEILSEAPVTVRKIVHADMPTLPDDCINILDSNQVEYWKKKNIPEINNALAYLKKRKWDTAEYKPETIWFTFKDRYFSNRIILPFYDFDNQIVTYQGRSIDSSEHVRWKTKFNAELTCFNIHKVDPNAKQIFLCEGPADAMFCENGIGVAGIKEKSKTITLSVKQKEQLNKFPFHKRIWCLDSQWIDDTSLKVSNVLANLGESIFIWPEKLGKQYGDFNDIALGLDINRIPGEFIMKYVHQGLKAQQKLDEISRSSHATYGALSGHDAQIRHQLLQRLKHSMKL